MPERALERRTSRMDKRLVFLFGLTAAEALCAAAVVLWRGSGFPNEGLSDLSMLRLGVALALLTAAGTALWLATPGGRRQRAQILELIRRGGAWVAAASIGVALVAWIASFLPSSDASRTYLSEARPVALLVLAAAVQGLLLGSSEPSRATVGPPRDRRQAARIFALASGVIAATWLLIAASGIGLRGRGEDYWYGSGVPVLSAAALAAFLVAAAAMVIEDRLHAGQRRGVDAVVFLFIWLATGMLWAGTAAPNSWFNPGPFPPTHQTYPFSDAAKYDIAAQFALIGQGLDNEAASPRPAYPAFLVLVHVLTGQDYEANMRLQAALLGVFPALLYLFGSRLHSRPAGMAVAVLVALRGMHAIAATNLLDQANAKLILPDFPAALGMAALLLVCAAWFRVPARRHYALLAGGIAALTVYLRPTALGALPAVVLAAIAAYRSMPRKQLMAALGLFAAGYLLAALPWELRSQVVGGARYPPTIQKILYTLQTRFPNSTPVTRDGEPRGTEAGDVNFQPVVLRHVAHNLFASALILPTSPVLTGLDGTVRNAPYTNWKWEGGLSPSQVAVLAAGLALCAAGIAAAATKHGAAGWLPAAAFIGYQLANALGRTSGGRYIVPVDWIVLLYYALGAALAVRWAMARLGLIAADEVEPARTTDGTAAPQLGRAAAAVLLCGALLVLPDVAFGRMYEEGLTTSRRAVTQAARSAGLGSQFVDELLGNGGEIRSGRILYPRYSHGNASAEFFFGSSFERTTYPQLVMSMIGPDGLGNIRLAGAFSGNVAHYSDAVVLGCEQEGVLEAALVVLPGSEEAVYIRSPRPPARCPFPEPVCDGNRDCR